jgi:hypothetical protein
MEPVEYFDNEKNSVSHITLQLVQNPHQTLKDWRSDVKLGRKPPEDQWSRWPNSGNVGITDPPEVMTY